MRFISFFSLFILFNAIWATYITWRLIGGVRSHRFQAFGLFLLIFGVLAMTPGTIMLRRAGWGGMVLDLVTWSGYLGLALFSFLLAFLLILDFFRFVIMLKERFLHLGKDNRVKNPERRRFLFNGINTGMFAGSFLTTGYGLTEAKRVPRVKMVDIALAGLPKELDGFRIVQITDVHVGHTLGRSFVEEIVSVVNGLEPDIVALTGDLVDGSVGQLSDAVAPLAGIRSGFGNFFVTGNHEYYSGVTFWVEKIKALGFTVLLNEHYMIHRGNKALLMAGVTDLRGEGFFPEHRSDPKKAVEGAPPADIKILLAHQPKSVFEAAKVGYDLQISGHTHGGQFFPWTFLVGFFQPYVAGLYTHENTRLYVSRGTGYWGPPVRVGSPSEITLLRLKKETPAGEVST